MHNAKKLYTNASSFFLHKNLYFVISMKSLLLSKSNLVRWPQFSPPQQRTDYISCWTSVIQRKERDARGEENTAESNLTWQKEDVPL